jgi:hypothetical protein
MNNPIPAIYRVQALKIFKPILALPKFDEE